MLATELNSQEVSPSLDHCAVSPMRRSSVPGTSRICILLLLAIAFTSCLLRAVDIDGAYFWHDEAASVLSSAARPIEDFAALRGKVAHPSDFLEFARVNRGYDLGQNLHNMRSIV